MNLRKRILTSLVIMLVLPFVMLLISIMLMVAYQDEMGKKEYGTHGITDAIMNPVSTLDYYTKENFQEIKELSESEPEKLLEVENLDELSKSIDAEYSFLLVRKGNEIIYSGNNEWTEHVKEDLPEYNNNINGDNVVYVSGEEPYLIKQLDFSVENEKCSAFIIIYLNNLIPQVKAMSVQIIFHFVIISVCTAIVLIIWLYASMLKPLKTLSHATKMITKGDLDFSIEGETGDELGDLCADFEIMRKRLKEHVEKQELQEKETRELIANISHDLKTPLTAIQGYSEGLLDGVAGTKDKQDKYIRTIYNKANQMSNLVEELSLYAKINEDSLLYNFTSVDVDDYFTDCIEEIKEDMDILDIELEYKNNLCEGVKVVADPEQLKRVIDNIINNSVKYFDKHPGNISVSIDEYGDSYIQIAIKDNGMGIDDNDINKIFDRFYRGDKSRNSKSGGTGLGLAIAKKIIMEHGGNIWVQSKEKVGTTIFFTLERKNENV